MWYGQWITKQQMWNQNFRITLKDRKQGWNTWKTKTLSKGVQILMANKQFLTWTSEVQ
jgi:hypothetical protein